MPKSRKPAVALPPFPWQTEAGTGPATKASSPWPRTAPLARRPLERGTVDEPADGLDDEGNAVAQSSPVWRQAVPPLVRALAPHRRKAVEDYAEAVEAVAGTAGATAALESGGGGSSAPTGPSLTRLAAAERLRDMREGLAALGCVEVERGAKALPLARLVDLVAVEGRTSPEVARSLGIKRPTRTHKARIAAAWLQAADVLAERCGFATSVPSCGKSRNLAVGRGKTLSKVDDVRAKHG